MSDDLQKEAGLLAKEDQGKHQGWAFLKDKKGAKVRCRVAQVAKEHVSVRGIPSEES